MTESTDRGFLDSGWGKVLLLVAGAVTGAVIGEPMKHFFNRAAVTVNVVSVEAGTRVSDFDLRGSRDALSKPIVGDSEFTALLGDVVEASKVEGRFKKLREWHDAYPRVAAQVPEAGSAPARAFFATNADYVRSTLDLVAMLAEVDASDREQARRYAKSLSPSLLGLRPPSLDNVEGVMAFVRAHQDVVHAQTEVLLTALTDAMNRPELRVMKDPSFEVTLDVVNDGGTTTSIRAIGALRVKAPAAGSRDTVVILTLEDAGDESANPGTLAPGARSRVHFTTTLPFAADSGAGEEVRTLTGHQSSALRSLALAYPKEVYDCSVTVTWGSNKQSVGEGRFGRAQAVRRIKEMIDTASR